MLLGMTRFILVPYISNQYQPFGPGEKRICCSQAGQSQFDISDHPVAQAFMATSLISLPLSSNW